MAPVAALGAVQLHEREVVAVAKARRADVETGAARLPRQRPHVACRRVAAHHDHGGRTGNDAHGREAAHRVVTHLALEQRDVRHQRIAGQQQCVAVGFFARHQFVRQIAARARAVLDHEARTQPRRQGIREFPAQHVHGATGRQRQHQAHIAVTADGGMGPGAGGQRRAGGSQPGPARSGYRRHGAAPRGGGGG